MDKIGDQLPTIGITAASLTLVFLGFMFASWDAYDAEGRKSVRAKYRLRGWLAFSGIVFSLLAVLFGFIGIAIGHSHECVDWAGVTSLAAWAILITVQAVIALRDIEK